MRERLKESPVFKNGVMLSELRKLLISLKYVFCLEDKRSVLFQPYRLIVSDTKEFKAYYQVAFRELDPGLLFKIWQQWEELTNPMQKSRRLTT
jgi:hypothetical protein